MYYYVNFINFINCHYNARSYIRTLTHYNYIDKKVFKQCKYLNTLININISKYINLLLVKYG